MPWDIISNIGKFIKRKTYLLLHDNIPLTGQVDVRRARKQDIIPIFNVFFEVRRLCVQPIETQNVIVTLGKQAILDYLIGGINGDFYEIGVGTGASTAVTGDTDLQTPVLWKVATDRYRVGTDGFVGVTFAASEANTTWLEAGCRNRAGVLISRANINQIKTSDYVVTAEWKYAW